MLYRLVSFCIALCRIVLNNASTCGGTHEQGEMPGSIKALASSRKQSVAALTSQPSSFSISRHSHRYPSSSCIDSNSSDRYSCSASPQADQSMGSGWSLHVSKVRKYSFQEKQTFSWIRLKTGNYISHFLFCIVTLKMGYGPCLCGLVSDKSDLIQTKNEKHSKRVKTG